MSNHDDNLFAACHRPLPAGYGATRFRSDDTVRNGQQSVLAVDAIAFMDALGVDQAIIAGFDWGARTANVLAALWPERCRAMVSVSDYLIGSQAADRTPLPPEVERVVSHNYRWRIGLAAGEPELVVLEERLAAFPAISVPTITLEGDANGAPYPDPAAYAARFTGNYMHRTLTGGIGHNPSQEAPDDFVHAIEKADSLA